MKTPAKKQTSKVSKKQKVLIAAAGALIVLASWWAYAQFMPRPLGDKLEYLGKRDGGCWIGFCDAKPYTSYFYATDMAPQEVANYFSGASLADSTSLSPVADQEIGSYDISFSLKSTKDSERTIYVGYFSDGQKRMNDFNLKASNKKHVIEIDAKDYNLAKDSL